MNDDKLENPPDFRIIRLTRGNTTRGLYTSPFLRLPTKHKITFTGNISRHAGKLAG